MSPPVLRATTVEASGYHTPSGSVIPDIYPSKEKQRRELAELMAQDTILEVFAGKGIVSSLVYAKYGKRPILIDKDAAHFGTAKARLEPLGVSFEIHNMDNIKWIRDVLPSRVRELQETLTLVDFDFGMPGPTMQEFFKVFQIKKRLVVAVTDGGSLNLGFVSKDVQNIMKKMYGLEETTFSREDAVLFVDELMKKIAFEQGCTVKRINVDYNPKKTVCYAGYFLQL